MAVLDELRARFSEQIIGPDSPEYDTARSVWNGAINRRPVAIARCRTDVEVSSALTLGQQLGLQISVRGGGHSFAGFAVADDALMIDLSQMNSVTVDPASKRVTCEGGTTWLDIDAAAQAH